MDQSQLADLADKQIQSAAETTSWVFLVAVVFLWSGLDSTVSSFTVFSVKIERSSAFWVGLSAYVAAEFLIVDSLLRLGSIVRDASDEKFRQVATRICTHPWALNPFLTLGTSPIDTLLGVKGLAILVIIRWFCFTSLQAFEPPGLVPWWLLFTFFLLGGVGMILALFRVSETIDARLKTLEPTWHADFAVMQRRRRIALAVALVVAALFCWGVLRYTAMLRAGGHG